MHKRNVELPVQVPGLLISSISENWITVAIELDWHIYIYISYTYTKSSIFCYCIIYIHIYILYASNLCYTFENISLSIHERTSIDFRQYDISLTVCLYVYTYIYVLVVYKSNYRHQGIFESIPTVRQYLYIQPLYFELIWQQHNKIDSLYRRSILTDSASIPQRL